MIKKNAAGPKQFVDRTIDCDQVFERLTAGPFPQDDLHDGLVQWHLRCCHDCRSFAEAMRPAVGLFHEALAEQARVDLPVFTGTLPADDRMIVAVRQAIQQSVGAGRDAARAIDIEHSIGPTRHWPVVFVVAATLLMLIAFASGFGLYPLFDPLNTQIAEAGGDRAQTSTLINLREPDQPLDREQLRQWIETIDCSTAGAEMRETFAEHNGDLTCSLLKRICCSECHASAAEVRVALDVDQIASVVQACGKCHDWNN